MGWPSRCCRRAWARCDGRRSWPFSLISKLRFCWPVGTACCIPRCDWPVQHWWPTVGRKGPRARVAPARSVFGCEHDREHAHRLLRVARVFAALRHGAVVVVDFPENLLAVGFERAKVALAIRVIVRRKSAERLHLLADSGLIGQRQDLRYTGGCRSGTMARPAPG